MAILSEKLITELASPLILKRVVTSIDPRHRPADFKPAELFVMVGGGRGSGKSTLAELVASTLEEEGIKRKYIAEMGSSLLDNLFALPGAGLLRPAFDAYAKSIAKGDNDSALNRVGNEIFARARAQTYKQRSPIIVDYHMDDAAVVRRLVNEAKDNGYPTMFLSSSVTPEIALQRIAARQAKTGRRTDPQEAMKTLHGHATELPGYFGLFDVGMVFDNNHHYPKLIAMSKGGKLTLLDGEAYEQATSIAKEARQAGGKAGGKAHAHNAGTMAEGHATGRTEGTSTLRQGGFSERIADRLQDRAPPRVL